MNIKRGFLLSSAMVIASSCAQHASAQGYSLPSQFQTAKTAFLGNGGGNENEIIALGYVDLYRALTAAGRYRLVAAPADAELAFELSGDHPVNVVNGSSIDFTTRFRLVIRDVKTHALLWTFYEGIDRSHIEAGVEKAVAKLVDDLKALAAGTFPQTAPPQKTRYAKDKS